MRDLVTGATGFIGGHIADRLLREGRRVRVLCRAGSIGKLPKEVAHRAEIFAGDLRDRMSLQLACEGVERVFHCAGHVLDWGPDRDFDELNVRATEWLLQAAIAAEAKRFVHFSSIAVFGTPSPPRFDDDSPFGVPKDGYTRTKIAGEKIVSGANADEIEVVILRPAVVYGPRGTWLEEPLAMIGQNKMFLLGGGVGTCHPCYIENLVDASLLAATHAKAPGRAFIVADDDPITFRAYFDGIASIIGKAPIRRSIPLRLARLAAGAMELGSKALRRESRPLLTHAALDMITTVSSMSMDRIKTELGFVPRYDFASAIRELRELYQTKRETFSS